jgi:AcrR family transcriptional regulator
MQAVKHVRVHLWRSELFARDGFANTSVQQIVDAAVTKGAMYHHFRSKDDLAFGIYEHLLTLQGDHPRRSSPHAIQRRRNQAPRASM